MLCVCVCCVNIGVILLSRLHPTVSDDLLAQKEKNKLLQEEMESTLHDIQNM